MNRINFKALAIFILFCVVAIYSCSQPFDDTGKPVTLTSQDKLPFLVTNSDLIALVTIKGGLEEGENLSWFKRTPDKVQAIIHTIIKGEEPRTSVEILSEPKHLHPNAIKSMIFLRNGYHLAFLSITGEQYQPTTSMSLLDFFGNKIYPTWRTDHYNEIDSDGQKYSRGVEIDEVLNEIKNTIKSANKTLNIDRGNSSASS